MNSPALRTSVGTLCLLLCVNAATCQEIGADSVIDGTVLDNQPAQENAQATPVYTQANVATMPSYPIRFRGGLSYFNLPEESKLGGTYGLDGVRALTGTTGAYGAGKVNHINGGSQYLVTGGFYKMADDSSAALIDRIGVSLFYDYFHDTRGNDLDLTLLRLQVGYAIRPNSAIGIRYSEPLEDEVNPRFFLNNALANTQDLFRPSQQFSAFYSGYSCGNLVSLAAGYRKKPDTFFVEGSLRRPLSCNLYAFTDVRYEKRGAWVALAGFEYRFGPSNSCRRCTSCVGGGWLRNRRSPWDDPTIAESFNAGEAKTWGGVDQDSSDAQEETGGQDD